MFRLIVTKPAKQQLIQIASWTHENWGETQVEEYKFDLEMGLYTILDNAHIGQKAEKTKAGYRKLLVREHWIFYEILDDIIIVHGFLHSSQNPELHL